MTNHADHHPARLRDDTCDRDWILDRDVECADQAAIKSMSDKVWGTQAGGLLARSSFYRRKFNGINLSSVSLDDLAHLPLT